MALQTQLNLPPIGPQGARVAYFSMEIGIESDIPTYSGGLGVLAGDTLRAGADLGVPMVGVTLLYRSGHFRQELDELGNQIEQPVVWSPETLLQELAPRVSVQIEGREVQIRAWLYEMVGVFGDRVPIVLLDTDLEDNDPFDRALTGELYGGEQRYRLCQEVVLGMGGVAMLQALGMGDSVIYHMNEGHSALLALALLLRCWGGVCHSEVTAEDTERVRSQCVFTTHTPVPAGHDKFPWDLVEGVLGPQRAQLLQNSRCCSEGVMNMTYMALRFSRFVNGVALRHEDVSQDMFPEYPIHAITNGVHALQWTCPPMQALFDEHIPEWRGDNQYLRYALNIPLQEIRQAHARAKRTLLDEVQRRTGRALSPFALTLGFARRTTPYKRLGLLFSDIERLRQIVRTVGRLQIIIAGKAHPKDHGGKESIRGVFAAAAELGYELPVVYLEDYNMELAGLMTSGVDVWLNTPLKPHEASGTSGMKAALNGIPSLSVVDGWWYEGHIEGVTGWAIGDNSPISNEAAERQDFYDKLEHVVAPLYYGQPEEFARVMQNAIAFNGSFFNTQRMLTQYTISAYRIARQTVS